MSSNTTSPTSIESSVVPSTPFSSPASTAASSTTPKTNFKKPIAAIVGGVGGGMVIIGALLGICLVRKARKKPAEPIFSPMIRPGTSSPAGLMQQSLFSSAMTTNLTGSTSYHTGNTGNSMPQRFPTSAEIWLRLNITTIFCDVGFMHWVVPPGFFAEYYQSCIVIIWNFQPLWNVCPLSRHYHGVSGMRRQGGGIKWKGYFHYLLTLSWSNQRTSITPHYYSFVWFEDVCKKKVEIIESTHEQVTTTLTGIEDMIAACCCSAKWKTLIQSGSTF